MVTTRASSYPPATSLVQQAKRRLRLSSVHRTSGALKDLNAPVAKRISLTPKVKPKTLTQKPSKIPAPTRKTTIRTLFAAEDTDKELSAHPEVDSEMVDRWLDSVVHPDFQPAKKTFYCFIPQCRDRRRSKLGWQSLQLCKTPKILFSQAQAFKVLETSLKPYRVLSATLAGIFDDTRVLENDQEGFAELVQEVH